jgi:hypothetical protein
VTVADDGSKVVKDEYSRKARYLPGMLMLAPIGVVVAAAGWQDARIVTVLVGAATTVGLPVVLESFVRHRGLDAEVTKLPGSDGLWVTTRMLWPSADDPAEAARNAENRRVVERVIGRTLPTSVTVDIGRADGAAERANAVAVFDAAVADVRALTRSASTYPILSAENAEYGMWRNLRGVRTYGFLAAVVASVASVVLIVLSVIDRVSSSTAELVVGLLVVVALGAFWWVIPTVQRVRQAAERYALALFDAARLLGYEHLPTETRPPIGAPTSDPPA